MVKQKQLPLEPIPNTKFFEGCKRESCVDMCVGCNRIFENRTNILFSETTNKHHEVQMVCRAYLSPKAKWRNHTSQMAKKGYGKNEKTLILHFDPCNLASHIKHTMIDKQSGKVRVGQQKQR